MRNRSHVMTLSQDGTHPYAYARILGIFGLDILHGPTMSNEVRMHLFTLLGHLKCRMYRNCYILRVQSDS